jgi:molybdopterin-guanine dinucleotide biosynthesis protein A
MIEQGVTGIILSGGKSSRLGEEKGLALFRGRPLIEYAIDILRPVCEQIIVSANNQLNRYAEYGYQVVVDEVKNAGPIGGLFTCLKMSSTQYNFVLSCDTPFVDSRLYPYLLEHIENFQIAAPLHKGNLIEPLVACYATNVLWDIQRSIENERYKLHDVFGEIRFKAVKIYQDLPFCSEELFWNINTKNDIKRSSLHDS